MFRHRFSQLGRQLQRFIGGAGPEIVCVNTPTTLSASCQCRQQNGRVEEWSQRAEQLNAFVGSQHDRRLLLSAGNCSNTSSAAIDIKAFSSKPAGCRCCSRSIWQTDGRTDRRTPDRYVDPVLHTMRPALTIFAATATTITMYQTLISK